MSDTVNKIHHLTSAAAELSKLTAAAESVHADAIEVDIYLAQGVVGLLTLYANSLMQSSTDVAGATSAELLQALICVTRMSEHLIKQDLIINPRTDKTGVPASVPADFVGIPASVAVSLCNRLLNCLYHDEVVPRTVNGVTMRMVPLALFNEVVLALQGQSS